jgi:hypothetical protein
MDASKYKKDFKQTFVYVLKATTKVGDFKHDDINDFFKESYKDVHNDYHQMFLSLINSVFTHMSKTFIMSRSSTYHMCYHDPNVSNKIKVHANNYSTFLSFCFEKGYIKFLFCTETVAIGLNLPVKTTIFTDINNKLYTNNTEWQHQAVKCR